MIDSLLHPWGLAHGCAFITFAVLMVFIHIRYVLTDFAFGQRGTLAILVIDLGGFGWMAAWMQQLGIEQRWLWIFLGAHAAIHAGSVIWAAAHWSSLKAHMDQFQARELPGPLWPIEFIYEQSDTALYAWLAATLLTKLPVAVTLGLSIAIVGVLSQLIGRGALPTGRLVKGG